MLNLEWQPSNDQTSEPVVMLEVWPTGAILHGGSPIPVGAAVTLVVDNGKVPGHVVECGKDDDFGFLVEVGIDAPERWYPRAHSPAWQLEPQGDSGVPDFAHIA